MYFLFSHVVLRKKHFILLEHNRSTVVYLLANDVGCACLLLRCGVFVRVQPLLAFKLQSERRLSLSTTNLGQRKESCDKIHIYTQLTEETHIFSLVLSDNSFPCAFILEERF